MININFLVIYVIFEVNIYRVCGFLGIISSCLFLFIKCNYNGFIYNINCKNKFLNIK